MNRQRGWFLIAWLAAAGVVHAGWVREIEIKADPDEDGKRIYSFRFTPDKTQTYDRIEFECVYRQEFPWEDMRGRKYNKVHEPVTFIFRRDDIRFVNDLDAFINFRVPVSRKRLVAKYGEKTFNKESPIKLDRFRVTATANKKILWNLVLRAGGKFDVRALTEEKKPPDEAKGQSEKDSQ
jgi:hypothetical protein